MGWRDRDWAKWTDDERSRFLGGSAIAAPGALAAVVVSLVATVLLSASPGIGILHHGRAPSAPPLYGIGAVTVVSGRDALCTELLNGGCSGYTSVKPGQRILQAAPPPPGTTCSLLEVDQARGAWFCAPPGPAENS